MKEGLITLSQEQLKTFKVINSFIDKSITRQQAAELLSLSPRQITRLKKGILASGAEFLIHKNTGRKPAHAVPDEIKEKESSPYTLSRSLKRSISSTSKIYFSKIMRLPSHILHSLVY